MSIRPTLWPDVADRTVRRVELSAPCGHPEEPRGIRPQASIRIADPLVHRRRDDTGK